MRLSMSRDARLRLDFGSRMVLSCILSLASVAKLVHGYRSGYWLPEWAFYCIAIAELVLASVVWTRWRRFAGLVLVMGAVAAVGRYWISGAHWTCGCFGDWVMSGRQHLALLAIMGLCALQVVGAGQQGAAADERPQAGARG
jgi:hypothetical protein